MWCALASTTSWRSVSLFGRDSPSRLMPRARHFCSLQCWQRLRLVRSIRQFLCREQEYMALFCWLRRKKPLTKKEQRMCWHSKYWLGGGGIFFFFFLIVGCDPGVMNVIWHKRGTHLAAFAGDDTIMDARRFVPADFTGYHFYLSWREKKKGLLI